MTVLELMATMGLDTTEFDSKLTGAVEAVEDLSSSAEELTNPKLGSSGGSILKPLEEDAKSIDKQLMDLQTKTEDTSALMEGFVDVTGEIVKAGIEGLLEFASQSIDAAAATGSELANAFNSAKDDFMLGVDMLKVEVGEALLPIATWFYELGDAMVGMSDLEKMRYIGEQLQNYSNLNLERVIGQVDSLFGLFEEVEQIEPGNLGDYQEGLESQAKYWEDYANTLNSLKEKGVDTEFLGEIATGSAESLEILKSMDAADAAGMENLITTYTALQEAQAAAAESMNSVQLAVDGTAQSLAEMMTGYLVDSANYSGQGPSETFIDVMLMDLENKFPAVETMVDTINGKLAELGVIEEESENKIFKALVGEGEKLSIAIEASMSEESEGNLQGALDGMSLEGDAALYADPNSAGYIQSWLNTQNFTASVELVPTGGGGSSRDKGRKTEQRAVGLDYVPYNEYPASLHEGEAVLTKLEAERWRRGEDRGEQRAAAETTVVNQNIYVSENEDFEGAVYRALELMRWQG